MLSISKGNLLISDPFLKDPNFLRSVIFLCEHQEEGTVGFIINKLHDEPLENYIEASANLSFPLYYGGPVATNTLHFIHQCPDLISEGLEINDGIFWGGDFLTAFRSSFKRGCWVLLTLASLILDSMTLVLLTLVLLTSQYIIFFP
jgi:putative transcriptional regulator